MQHTSVLVGVSENHKPPSCECRELKKTMLQHQGLLGTMDDNFGWAAFRQLLLMSATRCTFMTLEKLACR